jgi:chemotaxis protein methyltransferase CheR
VTQATEWKLWDQAPALAPQEFEQIRQLARRTFGLDLKAGKEELVSARLRKLVRGGGFASFRDYCRHVLQDPTGAALASMIDALATNHTSFLREAEHFEFLRAEAIPALGRRETVEIWSAACSTGEEVWTLAMVFNEALPGRRVRILATDISNKALRLAQRAVYSAEQCAAVPAAWLARYFVPEAGPARAFRVGPQVRAQAQFRRLNLVEPFASPGQFPVIFCRNVMIYFDRPTQEQVIRQLEASLEPGGYLVVGHAESLARGTHALDYVRPAVYRKRAGKEGKWSKSS